MVSVEIDRALEWLQSTPFALAIAENDILFPWIESVHVLAIVLVVGTISIVDLRLLGVASLDISARRLMRDIIPYTWCAFAVAAVTGSLMFSSDATHYGHNRLFQIKLVMLVLAGLNMAAFHLFGERDIERWDAPGATTPVAAKAAASISLFAWIAIVSLGRGTGFTMH
ncbi:hypothetical protein SAMN05444170_4248 [Bradyrhizobium erythrophlei]|jgi:hypothetical protein|uniref:DUF6644 domain-containing protein n=1 Tax=Bradyrhizobium erythrophlei TaxID=1437360 RepID=A0A1M7UBB5_9BRAD|nr:hypothetical protein SAMN05444170_4248 [Bradyrhizobium erythrophlei]